MNTTLPSKELMDLFLRIVQRYNSMEKLPVRHETEHALYHSERHFLDVVGDRPGMNVTELAAAIGVTKGAISQVLKKLESKGVLRRYKKSTNDKEVFVELTKAGKEFYAAHQAINAETVRSLDRELARHTEDKVEFLLSMFRWLDAYLAESRERMQNHTHAKR